MLLLSFKISLCVNVEGLLFMLFDAFKMEDANAEPLLVWGKFPIAICWMVVLTDIKFL